MDKHFTCVASGHGAPTIPALPETWQAMRRSPQLAELCQRIENGEDSLKAKLPVWTPRCAGFKNNHRSEADVLVPLDRLMLDFDEKGRSDDILAKALELNNMGRWKVLLVEESVRHGTHVLIVLPKGMAPDIARQLFAEDVGFEADPAVKNVAGCIYMVPEANTRFISDDFWDPDVSCSEVLIDQNTPTPPEPATPRSLRAFDLCVKSAKLDPEKMDVWNVHNWHSNLMAVLSVGLPKLMTKEQLYAVVHDRLPNYSQCDDCNKLIEYFYEKYNAEKGFMSNTLRDINSLSQQEESVGESSEDSDIDELTKNYNPPAPPKKLPRIVELMVKDYDPRFHPHLIVATLPILAAHAAHYRATYINGKLIGPQQFVSVIAGSGQGKSYFSDMFKQCCKFTLLEWDAREWELVRENQEERDKKANAKDKPQKYHPKLRTFQTASKSSILELMNNQGANGMLLGLFSEVDELFKNMRQAFSDISVLLRKGWDGDLMNQFYLSEGTANTSVTMNISLLMLGTVNSMMKRMFSDVENGMMQRCIPLIIPNTKRSFRPPKQGYLNAGEREERDELMKRLFHKDLTIGDGFLELELPKTTAAVNKFFDDLEMLYNDGNLSDVEADLSHRCGEFILKAAIPLVALEGAETKEIVDFARYVGQLAHYNICWLFSTRVAEVTKECDQIMGQGMLRDNRYKAMPILSLLPDVFTLDELKKVRLQNGQSENVAMLLSRYCKSGVLTKIGRNLYKKKK